jgi:L-rhamnose mutarotase
MKTKRYCIAIEIKEEYAKSYADVHRKIKPEILEAYKEAGAEEILIWMYKNIAIVYYECEDIDMLYEKVAKYEIANKWAEKLIPWFAEAPDFAGSGKVQTCEKVTDLNQQLNGSLGKY